MQDGFGRVAPTLGCRVEAVGQVPPSFAIPQRVAGVAEELRLMRAAHDPLPQTHCPRLAGARNAGSESGCRTRAWSSCIESSICSGPAACEVNVSVE